MVSSYSSLRDSVESTLQDSSNAIYTTTELDYAILESLRWYSLIKPHILPVEYNFETRTGTATSTSASHLVDATESQFASTDVGKIVYNSTDHTWAKVTAYTSASDITLSNDIMASGENYRIFNKECTNNRQVNIEDITDYLSIDSIEYPIGTKRDWEQNDDIVEVLLDFNPDDTSEDDANKIVRINFRKRHKLSQLTDFTGAVNNAGGYSAGSVSMAVNGLQASGTIEADQEFTITGVRGTYTVTSAATISTNAATISFYPGLQSAVDNATVVTFKQSTLKPMDEQILINYSAGQAAVSKAVSLYHEAQGAIAIITTISSTIGAMTAVLTQAGTDLGSGRTAAGKIDAIITSGATKLADVSARLTQAASDIASGRTAAGKMDALITSANGEITLMNAEVDKAVSALTSALALVNTVPVGGGATEYMSQSNSDINAAQGYFSSGQAYMQQAVSDGNANNAYLGLATREIQAGIAKIQEASGFFSQARADEGAANAYAAIVLKGIGIANEYLSQAYGYMREVTTKLNISNAGKNLDQWGHTKIAQAKQDSRYTAKPKVWVKWGRN